MTQLEQKNQQEDLDIKKLADTKDVDAKEGLNTLENNIKDFWPEYLPLTETALNKTKQMYGDLSTCLQNQSTTNLNTLNQTVNSINNGVDTREIWEFKIAKWLWSTDWKVVYSNIFGNYIISLSNGVIKLEQAHFNYIDKYASTYNNSITISWDGKIQWATDSKKMNWKNSFPDPSLFVNALPFLWKEWDNISDYMQNNK